MPAARTVSMAVSLQNTSPRFLIRPGAERGPCLKASADNFDSTQLSSPKRWGGGRRKAAFGDPDPEPMLAAFREILTIDANDGVTFDADALRVDRIREELEYGGLRLRTTASISGARVNLVIDIGFGDTLEPGAEMLEYPTLLDFPAPRLRAYARETVIAEKFQAMVALGRTNSRMKDFYDIWILSRSFPFDGDRLPRAIAATFTRRETPIPIELPDALTPAFAADQQKQRQWRAFVEDVALDPGDLAAVIRDIADFLMPHAMTAARINQ